MDSTSESLGVDSDPVRHELPLSRDVASEFPPQLWHDTRKLKVLGMGTALPGRPVTTAELLKLIEDRFDIAVSRRGAALASRLNIATRHVCRNFETRHEAPRPGNSNPDLSAVALRMALEEAQLKTGDLAYLIGHTTSPACLVPPNISLVADRVGFAGPYMELRQACTGFANALVIAQGLVSTPGVKAVAIVGSETGSVYFDPQRAGEDVSQLVNLVMMGVALQRSSSVPMTPDRARVFRIISSVRLVSAGDPDSHSPPAAPTNLLPSEGRLISSTTLRRCAPAVPNCSIVEPRPRAHLGSVSKLSIMSYRIRRMGAWQSC